MRQGNRDIRIRRIGFNPRICKRCDCSFRYFTDSLYSFNPRICKRCDLLLQFVLFTQQVVSIHASVKDATQEVREDLLTAWVSIHASVKDATIIKDKEITEKIVSIHASVKDATDWLDPNNTGAQVSIHASVKDATFWAPVLVAHLFCFNPRICKRCDFYRADGIPAINVSIHASVKDATQVYLIRSVTLSFNPRICKRCDR